MRSNWLIAVLLLLAVAFLVSPSACIMDSAPLGSGPANSTTVNTVPSAINSLFVNYSCTTSGCHDANGNAPHLNTAAGAYSSLVNVTAGEICTNPLATLYVKPNDAANSVLMLKLQGSTCASSQMPLGGGSLSGADIQKLTDWINAGAQPGP